jgi:CheY-like chemotaxis protein
VGIQSLGRWRSPILTILIADHNEDVLNILKEQLLATNYALLYAQNGEEAIAFLDRVKSKVALAIIDLELPDLSGWDLIGRLTIHDRKLQDYRYHVDLPHPVLEKMKEMGVDAVVRKPIPHEEWRITLEKLLAAA